MSYILDALQRADAQRARGTVPGLHAKPLPGMNLGTTSASHRQRLWLAGLLAAVLLGAGVGFWVWRSMPPDAALTIQPVSAVLAPDPVLLPSAPPTQPGAVLAPSPASAQTPQNMPQVVAPPAALAAAKLQQPKASEGRSANGASQPVIARKPEAIASSPKAVVPTPVPAAPLAATEPPTLPVPKLADLPAPLRSQIPALTITGSVYSDQPSQRLLLVNNQVLPQGSTVAAELTLEEIRVRSAVFVFRGTRFQVAY